MAEAAATDERSTSPAPQKPKRPTREDRGAKPALRLTELARPEASRASTNRPDASRSEASRGSGASGSGATSSNAPGRDDVRAMVAESPQLIENGLILHEEDGDPQGVAYGTPVGEIDLLARDSSGGWVVVIIPEQSREKELVTELLQLMGWVRKHLCESEEEVRAIALLDWVPDDLGYAAAAVADTVEFKRYKLALTFEPLDV